LRVFRCTKFKSPSTHNLGAPWFLGVCLTAPGLPLLMQEHGNTRVAMDKQRNSRDFRSENRHESRLPWTVHEAPPIFRSSSLATPVLRSTTRSDEKRRS
jgi:hypothetical protein